MSAAAATPDGVQRLTVARLPPFQAFTGLLVVMTISCSVAFLSLEGFRSGDLMDQRQHPFSEAQLEEAWLKFLDERAARLGAAAAHAPPDSGAPEDPSRRLATTAAAASTPVVRARALPTASSFYSSLFECQARPVSGAGVYYNRVPKAGSTSLVEMVRTLHPHSVVEPPSTFTDLSIMPPTTQLSHARWVLGSLAWGRQRAINATRKKLGSDATNAIAKIVPVFDFHTRYIDFAALGLPSPTFVNFLRNPVSRAVSQYYYERWGDRFKPYLEKELARRGDQKDFDVNRCIAMPRANRTCGFNHPDENEMTGLFCGHERPCECVGYMATRTGCSAQEREAALELAKRHLLYNYSVFGLNEYFNESLRLFERLLPDVYAGISQLEQRRVGLYQESKETFYQLPTPQTVLRLLTDELELDAQLYMFALEVFNRRINACSLGSNLAAPAALVHPDHAHLLRAGGTSRASDGAAPARNIAQALLNIQPLTINDLR